MPNSTRLLTKAEFLATFREPMTNIIGREDEFSPEGVIDPRSYIAAIPESDFRGYSLISDDVIERVNRSADNQFDQVVYPCHEKYIYLVVVISLNDDRPYGHFLLDLNQEYGFDSPRL